VLGCVGAGGLAWWLSRAQAVADEAPPSDPFYGIAPPDEPVPVDPLVPNEPAPPDPGEVRDRYRPGPYVEVQGMLPDGRMRQQRIAGTWRQGRTVDNPWIVGGAELRPGSAPSPGGPGSPSLRSTDAGELTVIAGVPARIGVSAGGGQADDGAVSGLLIAFHDYPGHFFLPATVDTELGHIRIAGVEDAQVHFGIDAPVRADGSAIAGPEPHRVTMYVAAVDLGGRVSPYVERQLSVMPVGNGDVEVTLTMTQATDLDLYVVDPTGVVVYYGNDGGFSGGQLDLDANAACSGNMGVNNEHIFWPRAQAPAGTYTVRVAHFESCVSGQPVDYRVTVRNCGETVVLTGRFEGQGDTTTCDRSPGTNRNWCQDVVDFEVTPCDPNPV
jgi:hypothetical protein